MKVLGYILGGLRAVILLTAMALYLGLYFIATIFIKNTPERAFWLRRQWVKLFLFVTNTRVTIDYSVDELPDAALYISNHRTFSDPAIFARYIDAYVIAKAEVADLPILSTGAKATGVIYVKREHKSSRTAAREAMLDIIKSGYSVLVYAEGTTSNEPTTLPLKKGTFMEAAANQIPVVPMAIIYGSRAFHWFGGSIVGQYFKQYGAWRNDVHLAIGPVLRKDDHDQLHAACQEWIREAISRHTFA